MALGQVGVNNQNLGQGEIQGVERHFLFVGLAGVADEESQLYSVNAQTDLTEILADSALREQVIAAQLNAGQNWTAAVYPLAEAETIEAAIDNANQVQSFESVVVCDVQTSKESISAIHDKVFSLQATLGRFVSAIVALAGIDKATQTWPQYEAAMVAIIDTLACHLVVPVPQLHGNNVGVLAGRLCSRAVSIADSPMRVATGSVMGLGAAPDDINENLLPLSSLSTLANARLSVPQWYPDLEGMYWGDGSTLDATGGDYQVIENVRVVHQASRQVRILAIRKIADRKLNSTPSSIELHKGYFMKPLRVMSKSYSILGQVFPGDIMPPQDGDINIIWKTRKDVVIPMVVRPYNSPKSITVNIMLDLGAL